MSSLRPVVCLASCLLAACGSSEPSRPAQSTAPSSAPSAPAPSAPAAPAAPVAPTVPSAGAATPAALLSPPATDERAPDRFTVVLDTTKGPIELDVHRAWAPKGVDRFYTLVKLGYFTDVAFFRVIPGFMAQVGIHGDPRVTTAWSEKSITDDPVVEHNTRGRLSFATRGPDTRTTQFFINFSDNSRLDGMGFAPFAEVKNMEVVDRLFGGYGEGQPRGTGPSQDAMREQGNAYLRANFPQLDYIRSARIAE